MSQSDKKQKSSSSQSSASFQQFSINSKDQTSLFFDLASKYKSNCYQLCQQYHKQKQQQFSQSMFGSLADIQSKMQDLQVNQKSLCQLSQDSSIFASTADQIQSLTIQIKDSITEIQVDIEEVQKNINKPITRQPTSSMKGGLSGSNQSQFSNQRDKSLQVGVDILNSRLMKETGNFKQFLQDHQEVIKKQEAKKEKLIGKNNSRGRNNQIGNGRQNANNQKIRILPNHNGYQKVDSTDQYSSSYNGNSNGDVALQLQIDPIHESRLSSIQNIEKTLFEITGLFKRFANIVAEHQILVERIDANTENALADLEGARDEIIDTYKGQTDVRKLMMKIFFILIVFCTIYILFVL